MKSWIMQTLFDIRYSYWFIPSVMAVGATILAAALVAVDLYYLSEIPESLDWLFSTKPDGARAILSTVAGSTITVAGVVFSMTIMSVSHATANYGSRLLLQFLKDRKNQIALGTFTATFIYCLLVLRTVSSAGPDDGQDTFVPQVAVFGAIALALASVAVLIAFINHVPDTIHIGTVTAERGKELLARLEHMFPKERGEHDDNDGVKRSDPQDTPEQPIYTDPQYVTADRTGYVQALDISGLVEYCSKHSMRVEILKEPGDFLFYGEQLMRYEKPRSESDSDIAKQLFDRVGMGDERTPHQDARFLIEELQQITIRALSPGINDPFTAITSIDWLGAAIANASNRPSRSRHCCDDEGDIRLSLPEFDFQRLCDIVFETLRPYVVEDLGTTLAVADLLNRLINGSDQDSAKECLLGQAQQYYKAAYDYFEGAPSRTQIDKHFGHTIASITQTS